MALTVAEEKQAAFDAEIRQAVTEVRFELRNLQQTHHRVSKLLQEKFEDMEKKNVACTSTVATLERNIEHLLDRVVSTDRSDTASHIGGTPDERWEELRRMSHVNAPRICNVLTSSLQQKTDCRTSKICAPRCPVRRARRRVTAIRHWRARDTHFRGSPVGRACK